MLYAESDYKKIFQSADKDKDGYITYGDLRKLVKDVDEMFPEGMIKQAFDEAKIHIPPADKMDLSEFMEAMGKLNLYRTASLTLRRSGSGPILYTQISSNMSHWIHSPRFARYLYEAFFRETDTDEDGFIIYTEFQIQSKKYQMEYLDKTVEYEFKKHNTRGDGYMSLNEFMIAMGFPPLNNEIKKPKPAPPPVKVEPPKKKGPKFQLGASLLRQIFTSMDQDGDGVLNKTELKQVFVQLGQEQTNEEIDAMIKANDKEGDGCLTYDEFINSVMPTVHEVDDN